MQWYNAPMFYIYSVDRNPFLCLEVLSPTHRMGKLFMWIAISNETFTMTESFKAHPTLLYAKGIKLTLKKQVEGTYFIKVVWQ